MTDIETTETPASKSFSHVAYHVRDIVGPEGKKSFWTRIGVAFPHADGQGFTIDVAVMPLDGRITIRTVSENR